MDKEGVNRLEERMRELFDGDRYRVHQGNGIPEGLRNIPEKDGEDVHPDYYKGDNKDGKAIEVFDIIDQFVAGDFYLGNVLKYVCRAGKKSEETKRKDLEKAIHYLREALKRV